MKRSKRVALVSVAAAVAFVLAGCSSSSGGTQSTASSGPHTLRLSVQAPPSNLSIGNYSGGDATIFLSVYDTILHRDQKGVTTPGIADKWQYNSGLTELTLHVRSGQKFSNGEALDAQAVAASLEAARKGPSTAQNLASIASVTAKDASTVVIDLKQPDAAIVPTLAGTVGAVGAPSVLTADSSKLDPIGSGPYVLDKAKTTAGSKYVLEKNDRYWDKSAFPFTSVNVQVIADQTAVQNAIKAGQLDYAGLSSKDLAAQFPKSQYTTGSNKPGVVGVLWFADHAGKIVPALSDKRVRQAINLAFDRATIAKKVGPGYMTPTEQLVSPLGGAWDKSLNDTYGYNVKKAKQLLADAGYANGFSVTMPSTVLSTQFEPVITQSLADIGITVKWESVPFQDFYAKVFGGSYGMFFMYNGFAASDPVDINASLSGVFNPFQDTTPELQSLLAKANVSTKADAFADVNKYLVDDAWAAPIVNIASLYVVPNTVTYTPPLVPNQDVRPWAPAK